MEQNQRMSKKLIVFIVLIVILFLAMCAIGVVMYFKYKHDAALYQPEEARWVINSEDFASNYPGFLESKDMSMSEYVQYICSYKDEEYEIEYVAEGYDGNGPSYNTKEALLPSVVHIAAGFYCQKCDKQYGGYGTGNVYDIDDNYVYVISCAHTFCECPYYETGEFNGGRCVFIDGTDIRIDADNLYLNHEGIDIALIKIDRSNFSEETLSSLKTINFRHMYEITPEVFEDGKTFTAIKFDTKENKYESYYAVSESFSAPAIFFKTSTSQNGCSGGGWFDNTGTYFGFVTRSRACNPFFIFYIEDLLREANPSYFG